MKVNVDTNMLVSLLVPGDEAQQKLAIETLNAAELVAIAIHSLCELAWVMERTYGASRDNVAASIRLLMITRNVLLNPPAVEAGLNLLKAGGDFADGIIAYDGRWLGGETFVSFDKKAVKLMTAQDIAARLLH